MKTDTSKIKAALEHLRAIFKSRNTLPILHCVKLETRDNRLQISATNLDEYAVEKVEVDGELAPICASFNHLSLALSGKTTEITIKGNQLLVKCGNDETTIATQPADDFVSIPKFEQSQTHGAACSDLAKAISSVSWAASNDPSRYILNSVLIESKPKKLSVVSTNGAQLAISDCAVIGSEFEIVAPSAFVSNLSKMLSRSGSVIASNANQIKVTHDDGFYFCKQLEGGFPNYKHTIPSKMNPLGTVSVEEFTAVVSGCCGFSSDSHARGVFKFSAKELTIEFVGDNNSMLSRHLAGSFAVFTVALSTKKMLRVLQNIKAEEANLFYVDEFSPIRIDAGDLSTLTMPMRLD